MAGQKERMLAGEPYLADDPELVAERTRAALLTERFNTGSVVTRDIPAGVVAAGNPARILRKVSTA